VTNQEAFNKVVKHLLAQMKQSSKGDNCLYRGPNGTKCAIGCLIPDELYDPKMENTIAFNIKHFNNKMLMLFNGIDIDLLEALQEVHDQSSPDQWTNNLKLVAENHNLTWPGDIK